MLIDEKALTTAIFERYAKSVGGANEQERVGIADFVSLAHSAYIDLQVAKNAWHFIDNNEEILEASARFEGCGGSHLTETVMEIMREEYGKDTHKDAVFLILFGIVKSAARVGMQLVLASIPAPTNGGPTP